MDGRQGALQQLKLKVDGPGERRGRFRWRRPRHVAALALVASLLIAPPAHAVVDVRFERWELLASAVPADFVPPVDSTIALMVEFDATATAADAQAGGVRFAIAERNSGAAPNILARFLVPPCPFTPPAGSTIAVRAIVDLYCDPQGNLQVRDGVQWLLNWCEPAAARGCITNGLQPAAALPDSAPGEPWEFVVLDEHDAEGSFPTPDDVLACGPPAVFVRDYHADTFPQSGAVGLFADSTATQCSDTIVPFEPFRWYVIASLDGLTRCGLTTIELAIRNWPAELAAGAVANPAGIPFGDLFSVGGIRFDCERGNDDRIVLFTLDGAALAPVTDVVLEITGTTPSTHPLWPEAWGDLCPTFFGLRRRLHSGVFHVNRTTKPACEPVSTVQPATWTGVKSLYRR